jgi:hypothetical protein
VCALHSIDAQHLLMNRPKNEKKKKEKRKKEERAPR